MFIGQPQNANERGFIQKTTNQKNNIVAKAENNMKHSTIDTGEILTATTMISGLAHFATSIQPIISMCWGIVGILSGIFAIRYYIKKSKK